jgi:uracil phosphoribosyltransferase
VEVLLDHGVKESNIVFVNLISVPEGIENMLSRYPSLKMVTAEIDTGLDGERFITPGLGDFGCLYFGTVVKTDGT